jgi:hypothetical protein
MESSPGKGKYNNSISSFIMRTPDWETATTMDLRRGLIGHYMIQLFNTIEGSRGRETGF